jgi:hypothetical protein
MTKKRKREVDAVQEQGRPRGQTSNSSRLGTTRLETGTLVCIDQASGDILWSRPTVPSVLVEIQGVAEVVESPPSVQTADSILRNGVDGWRVSVSPEGWCLILDPQGVEAHRSETHEATAVHLAFVLQEVRTLRYGKEDE